MTRAEKIQNWIKRQERIIEHKTEALREENNKANPDFDYKMKLKKAIADAEAEITECLKELN